ncbi:glycoside hydrolase family 30 protein [Pedobacter chitinilyticus]|uniref:Glycosyl hydrolase n=1 Tax=Pedobacter chitinilyticus TaxID=2233776 RepID=A0A3S3R5I2_9SPHI|nr:glycoside hydrolase family 30 protein [Pedobacter chitinilyticus]RWU06274.1 glycosyl hydrolase [Pedobacter chitinilyticus]
MYQANLFTLVLAFLLVSTDKPKTSAKQAEKFTTAENTNLRISNEGKLNFTPYSQPLETEPTVFINTNKTFQTMVGIGGAITDASAEVFAKLPAEQQKEFLTAYYDKEKGIGYNLLRTNINSCDFSSSSYTYVKENDKDLKTFSVAPDEQFKIPLIKKAIAAAGGKLTTYVSPWSPPAFMKTNNSMLQGGKLKAEYQQAWANYYIKFIQEYEKRNIPIWGLTMQNEPMAKQRWESCIYTAEEERDFIKNYLGPTLHKSGMANKKLIAWDHNRDLIYHRASTILNDPQASKYVWGIGFHWYETWTGSKMQFDNLRKVNESFPDKQLIFTEGCKEKFSLDSINNWSLGERYGHSMINDFNNGTAAWTDWNILLDEKGGPNHVQNYCFAPIHADTRTGKLIYTNAYYYLGHFSKFIKPGAKRIITSSTRDILQTSGFLNPDGKIVIVVMNTSDKNLDYQLWLNGEVAKTQSQPHSISTFIVN